MEKQIFEEILDTAISRGLSIRECNSNLNSYPDPRNVSGTSDRFVFGFRCLDDASAFAYEFGGTVCSASWKAGDYHFAHRVYPYYETVAYRPQDFANLSDDRIVCESAAQWEADNLDTLRQAIIQADEAEDIRDLVEDFIRVRDLIQSNEDYGLVTILNHSYKDGIEDALPGEFLEFSSDTTTYAIGVKLDFQEIEEGEE